MRSQAESSRFDFGQLFSALEETVSRAQADNTEFNYFPIQTKRDSDETDFKVCELIEQGLTSWREIKTAGDFGDEQLCESFRRLILELEIVGCRRSGLERSNRIYYLKADFRLLFSP
jgi:hypothetical protein